MQHARTEDGRLVAGRILDHLRGAQRGGGAARLVRRRHRGDDRRRVDPGELDFDFNGPILAPGFGAQGGTVCGHPAHLRLGPGGGDPELVARAAAARDRLSRRCGTRRCGSTTSCARDPCWRSPCLLWSSLLGPSCSRAARTSRRSTATRSRTTSRSSGRCSARAVAGRAAARRCRSSRTWPTRRRRHPRRVEDGDRRAGRACSRRWTTRGSTPRRTTATSHRTG